MQFRRNNIWCPVFELFRAEYFVDIVQVYFEKIPFHSHIKIFVSGLSANETFRTQERLFLLQL